MRWLLIFATLWVVGGALEAAYAQEVTRSQVVARELHAFFPRAQIRLFDRSYESLSTVTFLNDFVPLYSQFLAQKGLSGIDAGFSEKHYAQLCKTQLQLWLVQVQKRKLETECAVLVTDPQALSANPGLPTGWLLIRLDGVWQVFDAARLTLVPLESFSYRAQIASVLF